MELPPSCILRSWIHVQLVSSCVDLTKVKCTPKLRCTAEQSIQINTPYVTVAHVGFFASQSKHVLFVGMARSRLKTPSISCLLGLSSAILTDVLFSRCLRPVLCHSQICRCLCPRCLLMWQRSWFSTVRMTGSS